VNLGYSVDSELPLVSLGSRLTGPTLSTANTTITSVSALSDWDPFASISSASTVGFRFTAPRLQPVPLALVPVVVTNAEPVDRIDDEDLFYTHPVSGLFGSLDDAIAMSSLSNPVSLERAESEIMYGATAVCVMRDPTDDDDDDDDDRTSWASSASSTLSSASTSLASKECAEATNPVLRSSIVVLDVDTSTSVI